MSELRKIQYHHAIFYKDLLQGLQKNYLEGSQSLLLINETLNHEWSQIQSGQRWASQHFMQHTEARQLCSEYPICGRLIITLKLYGRQWLEWLEPALASAEQLNDRNAVCKHLYLLGSAHSQFSDYATAEVYYWNSLSLAKKIGDDQTYSYALFGLGSIYDVKEELDSSDYLNKALSIAEKLNDKILQARIHLSLSNLQEEHKKEQHLQRALDLARQAGDIRFEGIVSYHLGTVDPNYKDNGKAAAASSYLKKSLSIARLLGDKEMIYQCLFTLGEILTVYSYVRAITQFKQAVYIAQDLGFQEKEGQCYLEIGKAYHTLGRYDEALGWYSKTKTIGEGLDNLSLQLDAIAQTGVTLAVMGAPYEQLLASLEPFSDVLRRAGKFDQSKYDKMLATLDDLSRKLWQQRLFVSLLARLRPLLMPILEISGSLTTGIARDEVFNLGDLDGSQIVYTFSVQTKEYRKILAAEAALANAMKTHDVSDEVDSLFRLGQTYEEIGHYKRAIDFYERASERAVFSGDLQKRAEILKHIGLAYLKTDEYDYYRVLDIPRLNEYSTSIDYFEQARALYAKANNPHMELKLLVLRAEAETKLLEDQNAIDLLEQALVGARKLRDRALEGRIYSNFGLVYRLRGRSSLQLKSFRDALDIAREIGDRRLECELLWKLGTLYLEGGQLRRSRETWYQLLFTAQDVGHPQREAQAFTKLALIYSILSQKSNATECLSKATELYLTINVPLPWQELYVSNLPLIFPRWMRIGLYLLVCLIFWLVTLIRPMVLKLLRLLMLLFPLTETEEENQRVKDAKELYQKGSGTLAHIQAPEKQKAKSATEEGRVEISKHIPTLPTTDKPKSASNQETSAPKNISMGLVKIRMKLTGIFSVWNPAREALELDNQIIPINQQTTEFSGKDIYISTEIVFVGEHKLRVHWKGKHEGEAAKRFTLSNEKTVTVTIFNDPHFWRSYSTWDISINYDS